MTLRFRPACAEDYPLFLRLYRELRVEDPPADEEVWASHVAPDAWIMEREGEPVGYAFRQILDEEGYLRHLVVDPGCREEGLGHAAMAQLTRELRAAGVRRLRLNVKPDNRAAIALYERHGLRRSHGAVSLRLAFAAREGLPVEPTLGVCEARPDELAELERRATPPLPKGQLARQAGRDGVWILIAGGEGLAVFDAGFGGSFPFRASHAAVARALLDAMAERASKPEVLLVVEDDAGLADTLRGVGATTNLAFDHYVGELTG